MNTVRSVGYGWAVLIVAGGGSYYYAKRSVNRDREERALSDQRRRAATQRLRDLELMDPHPPHSTTKSGEKSRVDHQSASKETAGEPAPVTPAQVETAARGKYEAAEPYRSRKGDRFS